MSESKKLKPCKECPFSKKANLDIKDLGGSQPVVYIGQAAGPFWLPCHMDNEYKDKQSDPAEVSQCRGAAIFRANVGIASQMPKGLLQLPEDKEESFDSFEEFLAHYHKIPIAVAKRALKDFPPVYWMLEEMKKTEVKLIPKTKL